MCEKEYVQNVIKIRSRSANDVGVAKVGQGLFQTMAMQRCHDVIMYAYVQFLYKSVLVSEK